MSDWHPETRSIISYEGFGWRAFHIAEFFGRFSATEIFSDVVHLDLGAMPGHDRILEGMDDVERPLLLLQISAVQTLNVSHQLAGVCRP